MEDLRIQQYGDTAVLVFRPAGSVQDGTHDFYAIRDGKPGKLACVLSYNHELTQ